MAKRVVGFETGDDGKVRHYASTQTRAQRKSTQHEIPWTLGPQTAWQRFVRKAIG